MILRLTSAPKPAVRLATFISAALAASTRSP